MKFAVAPCLAATVFLVGCDAFLSSSEHQARLQIAEYSGWLRAKSDSIDRTIRQIGTVHVGRLGHGEEITIPLDITGAHDATVIAACDRSCADLDLRIVTADGRLMELDEAEDDTPRVDIEAGKTNKLVLKVRMPSCRASSCAYAVSQFQYDDPVTRTGTCFAVSRDGLLMTSYHVVDTATKITVVFPDGRKGEAEVLRESTDNDLALLRTKVGTPEWLPLGNSSDISVGMSAFTIGFPNPEMLGAEAKFTEGNVTSLSGPSLEPTLLQVSIPIQPGSSGGPVVSYSGKVIGVIDSSIEEDGSGSPMQLTNFARHAQVASLMLPSETALPPAKTSASRDQLLKRVMKSVCKVETG
jgi:S1-C subfamily serine protease